MAYSSICFFFNVSSLCFEFQVSQYEQTIEQLSSELALLKDNNERDMNEVRGINVSTANKRFSLELQ